MAKAKAGKAGPVRPYARVGDTALVERRRAQIIEAATRLVSRQGFAKTVVRDIADEAKISVGLVYEYVRSKEDILFLIYEHWASVWLQGLSEALSGTEEPLERLEAGFDFLVHVAAEHPDVTHLFYREAGNLSDHGRDLAKRTEVEMVDRLVAPIQEAIDAELLRPDTDVLLLATNLVLLAHGYVLKGYLLRKDHSPEKYAAAVIDSSVAGYATPLGRKAWERHRG